VVAPSRRRSAHSIAPPVSIRVLLLLLLLLLLVPPRTLPLPPRARVR
jgi:hypothetical protein